MLNIDAIRREFPILEQTVNGQPLVYLDSAASSQKPRVVLESLYQVYETTYANIHRGVHSLGQNVTRLYEEARENVANFIHAPAPENIIFCRGGTEAINIVANTWGKANLEAGDKIVISALEHHANIVPWQMLVEEVGCGLLVCPLTADGQLDLDKYKEILAEGGVKLVSMAHLSNVLGTLLPVEEIITLAHAQGAKVLIDGCQALPRLLVDVQALDVDFYIFSGHKCYAPSGIGVLYGKGELLNKMPPYQGGGDMIDQVKYSGTTYAAPPARFEAGTPFIEGAIALSAALSWLNKFKMADIWEHEKVLRQQAYEGISKLDGFTVYGPADGGGVVSFSHAKAHANDLAMLLDEQGIAIRSGHHCAQPLHEDVLGISCSARASFGIYNTAEEVDALLTALEKAAKIFA